MEEYGLVFYRSKNVKGRKYWYLVTRVREGGKVKSKHLAYIGKTKPTMPPEEYLKQLKRKQAPPGRQKLGTTPKPEIEKIFRREAKRVWGNEELLNKIALKIEFREQKSPVMVLAYSGRPYTIGETLVRVPRKMTLILSSEIELTKKELKELLRHESIHIGYPRHDHNFRRVAKKDKTPLTVRHARSGLFTVQIKVGHRYQTVKELKTMEEAEVFADSLAKKQKGRIRIRF